MITRPACRQQEAVTRYFERTGERWDDERCELVTLSSGEYWSADEEKVADARR